MAGLQLSGLASGFDWTTFVDSLMELERAPITRLQTEQSTNSRKATALSGLDTRLTELQTAVAALNKDGLFTGRSASASSSSSLWSTTASAGAAVGNYTFAVSQLATTTRMNGTASISSGLNATNDVSGLTIASLRTAADVTAGDFTVNGQKISVALTDSLQDVFARISTASGGDITASYDSTTDRVTLTSASDQEIVLGAGNDTSNFLGVMRLANNGTDTVSSSTALASTDLSTPLATAGLRTAITNADGSGASSFAINGTTINYNVNTDTLGSIMARINSSSAGVTASYDTTSDRMVLTNRATGNTGMNVSEAAGGVLGALGLATGATLARGKNTLFSVNGGATIASTSNTLDAAAHGITGLTVTAATQSSETISVSASTGNMRTAIESFVSKFNAVQTYIDEQSKITTTNGKVNSAVLASNREVQSWAQSMRSTAFSAVAGLSGTITRLESLGIDFSAGTGPAQLTIKDSTKLDTALREKPSEVEAFFRQSSTGFAAKFNTFLDNTLGVLGGDGALDRSLKLLTTNNTVIDTQIADIERRLVERRSALEAGFIAMETAQQKLKTMQTQLTNAFSSTTK